MARSILKNTMWGLVGEMSIRLSKIGLMILMARMLGPIEVGRFNFAFAQAGLFTVFFDFGVSAIAVRETSRCKKPLTFLTYCVIKMLGAVIGIVALMMSAMAFQLSVEEWLLMVGVGLFLALNDLSTFAFTLYRARNEFWRETMWRAVFSIVQFIACFVAILMGFHVGGVVLALIISATLGLAPLAGLLINYRHSLRYLCVRDIIVGIRQCLPMAGMVLIGALYANMDVVVLGAYVSKEEVGWYSIAVKTVFSMLIMPLHYFHLATLPVFSADIDTRSAAEFRAQWLRGFVLSTTGGSLLILVTALGALPLLSFLFGEGFIAAAPILQIYGLVGFLYYLYTPLAQQLLLHGRQRQTLYIQMLALGLNFIMIYLCIPAFGVEGAVLAAGASHALIAALHFIMVWRYGGFTRHERDWWSIVRVSIGLTGAVMLLSLCSDIAFPVSILSVAFFFICCNKDAIDFIKIIHSEFSKLTVRNSTI